MLVSVSFFTQEEKYFARFYTDEFLIAFIIFLKVFVFWEWIYFHFFFQQIFSISWTPCFSSFILFHISLRFLSDYVSLFFGLQLIWFFSSNSWRMNLPCSSFFLCGESPWSNGLSPALWPRVSHAVKFPSRLTPFRKAWTHISKPHWVR